MSASMLVSYVTFLVIVLRIAVATKATLPPTPPKDCHNLNSQKNLALDKMLGVWYAVELVEHFMQEIRTGHAELPQCPVFTLRQEMRNTSQTPLIRLLWAEGEKYKVEYSLIMPEQHHKSFWKSTGNQNGSLADNSQYRQFSGTVHVMRATGDHAVLTFCSEQELQVFSVLLSRERTMRTSEIRSINNMLARRGLPVTYTKSTCHSNTAQGGNIASTTNIAGAMFVLLATTVILH